MSLDYMMKDDGIFISGGIFSKTIAYADIVRIEKVSYFKAMISALHPFKPGLVGFYTSRIPSQYYVVIETKRSRYLASPIDPDGFIDLARRHLKANFRP